MSTCTRPDFDPFETGPEQVGHTLFRGMLISTVELDEPEYFQGMKMKFEAIVCDNAGHVLETSLFRSRLAAKRGHHDLCLIYIESQ